MMESPKTTGFDGESNGALSEINPLARFVAANGGTIESAYRAYARFMNEGTRGSEEEQEQRRLERAKRKGARGERKSDGRSEGQEERSDEERNSRQKTVHGSEKKPAEPKPKTYALDPALSLFEAWMKTFPWKAGLKQGEEHPHWIELQPPTPEPELAMDHQRVAFRRRLRNMFSTAASLL